MRTFVLAVTVAFFAVPALAGNYAHTPESSPPPPSRPADNWAGAPAHVAVSALAGIACANHIYPREGLKSFGCAMAPGLVKEVIDSTQKGNRFSVKDLIADAVGAGLGVYVGGLMLDYNERTKTTTVAIRFELK